MLPVLMFASGIVAGVLGVQLAKKAAHQPKPDLRGLGQRTRAGLRDATVSGLTAIESQAASLRSKLTPDGADAPPAEAAEPAAAETEAAAAPEAGAAEAPKSTAEPS